MFSSVKKVKGRTLPPAYFRNLHTGLTPPTKPIQTPERSESVDSFHLDNSDAGSEDAVALCDKDDAACRDSDAAGRGEGRGGRERAVDASGHVCPRVR